MEVVGNRIDTCVFRKEIFPERYFRYDSCVPSKYRENLVSCLLGRAKRICSSQNLYQREKENIKIYLLNSGFRMGYVEFLFRKIENKLSRLRFCGPLQKPLYFGMNYYGQSSDSFACKMRDLVCRMKIPGSKCVVYNKSRRNLLSLFSNSYKFSVVKNEGKPGIYKIPCSDCNKSYFGQTGRPFSFRLSEHKKFSGPLGKSAIYDHQTLLHHKLDFDNSKLFWPEHKLQNRLVLEALFIKGGNVFENNSVSCNLNVFT